MTQKKLSRITGITESSISHYVKGDRVPRGINLLKMSKALNVTSDYLLGDDCEQAENNSFNDIKTLIVRNAIDMTDEEKIELVRVIMENKWCD